MKIFISWSGKYSLGVATAVRDWLPNLFNPIHIFHSSESVRKGERWLQEVNKELDESDIGIACLTPDNLQAEWLHFETGALSKSREKAKIYTLLVGGLTFGDIKGPLSQFQHTLFQQEDFFKLVQSINEAHPATRDDARLRVVFDKWWGDLEKSIANAMPKDAKKKERRDHGEMLDQLLPITSQIARNMPDADAIRKAAFQAKGNLNVTQMKRVEAILGAQEHRPHLTRLEPLKLLADPDLDVALPEHIHSILEMANITSLKELTSKTPSQLRQIGVTVEAIETIMAVLAADRLRLARPDYPPPRYPMPTQGPLPDTPSAPLPPPPTPSGPPRGDAAQPEGLPDAGPA